MKISLVKREEASELVLTILIWSVLSLLLTRVFINVSGQYQLSFGVWHIAHVLWGGLFLLGGIITLVAWHGETARKMGAIFSGIGWGLFVDEIGKYLTSDNDYWFRPAIILMYVIFVLLFLIYRKLEKSNPISSKNLLYSILVRLEDVAEDDLEVSEKDQLLKKINTLIKMKPWGNSMRLAMGLEEIVKSMETKNDKGKGRWSMWWDRTKTFSYKVFKRKFVKYLLAIYSIYFALDKVIDGIRFWSSPEKVESIKRFYLNYDFFGRADLYMAGFKLTFDLISGTLLLVGWYYFLKKRRGRGVTYFRWGLLVNILLASVFKFYFEQFSGVFDLALAIGLFSLLGEYRREITG